MPGIETSPTYGEINFIPYVPSGYAGATLVIALIVIIIGGYIFWLFAMRRRG
jgi:hypothetical protein